MNPTELSSWKQLAALAKQQSGLHLSELTQDPSRVDALQLPLAGCLFDFTRQRVNQETLTQLVGFAQACELEQKREQMLSGSTINVSENRAVLHTALRGGANAGTQIDEAVDTVQQKMRKLAQQIRTGAWLGTGGRPITDVVHIGIGGSHLGPELVVEALRDHHSGPLTLHFVANIDANDIDSTLAGLNPETTLFIVASKSFGTLETQVNALSARSWFLERTGAVQDLSRHFVGITTNIEAAVEFGLDPDSLLPMWDWVGGRFSLWSAVGLPILLALGEAAYDKLLGGAKSVDQHFATTPLIRNVPVLSALFATWNYNFLGAASLAMLSYDERLDLLPDYLQQLEMESNGKSVNLQGEPVGWHTMPILWGGVGTKGQHAYHQLLHQGTREFAADFIVVAQDERQRPEHHTWLLANALGQGQAMAQGFDGGSETHRSVRGNHPSTTIVLDQLGPEQLGGLLAVYEHKVFCQGVFWDINSFDQWGVELGKNLAVPIHAELSSARGSEASARGSKQKEDGAIAQDAATQSLINYLKRRQ